MKKIVILILAVVASLIVAPAFSQTSAGYSGLTGNGTPSTVPVFTTSKKIGNSNITVNSSTATVTGNLVVENSQATNDLLLFKNNTFGVGNSKSLSFIDATNNSVGKINLTFDGSFTSFTFGSLFSNAYTSGSVFKIRGDGNVFIGTSNISPSARLHVLAYDNTSAYDVFRLDNLSGNIFKIRNDGVIKISQTTNASPSDGDLWYDGTHLYFRIGSTTKQLDN